MRVARGKIWRREVSGKKLLCVIKSGLLHREITRALTVHSSEICIFFLGGGGGSGEGGAGLKNVTLGPFLRDYAVNISEVSLEALERTFCMSFLLPFFFFFFN